MVSFIIIITWESNGQRSLVGCSLWDHKELYMAKRLSPWKGKWQFTPVFLPGNPKDRGAWWATVHGVTRVGYYLVTIPPPPRDSIAQDIIIIFTLNVFSYCLICHQIWDTVFYFRLDKHSSLLKSGFLNLRII